MGCFPTRPISKESQDLENDDISIRFLKSSKLSKIATMADFSTNLHKLLINPRKNSSNKYEISSETYGFGHFGLNSLMKKGLIKAGNLPILLEIIRLTELDEKALKKLSNFFENLDFINVLDHPCLLRLLDVYEEKSEIFLIFEDFSCADDLYDKICEMGSFTEKVAGSILRQILSFIAYLHRKGLRLMKISAESFHIRYNHGFYQVKFMDFSAISPINTLISSEEHKKSNVLIRDFYSAPENVFFGLVSEKTESFSVGVLMFLMLKGCFPFNQDDFEENSEENYQCYQLNFAELQEDLSMESMDLLKKLLEIDDKKRLSALEALNSKFVKNYEKIRDFERNYEFFKDFNNKSLEIMRNPLVKLFRSLLVRFYGDPEEKSRILEIFEDLDEDNDGVIEGKTVKFEGNMEFEEFLLIFVKKYTISEENSKEILFKEMTKGEDLLTSELISEFLGKERVEKTVVEELFKKPMFLEDFLLFF